MAELVTIIFLLSVVFGVFVCFTFLQFFYNSSPWVLPATLISLGMIIYTFMVISSSHNSLIFGKAEKEVTDAKD